MSFPLAKYKWTNFSHMPCFWLIVFLPLNLKISILGYRLSWFRGSGRGRIRSPFRDSWLGRSVSTTPSSRAETLRGNKGRGHCARIRASCVSAALHRGRGVVESEWKKQRMKEKMKERAYEREWHRKREGVWGEGVKPVQLHTQSHYTSICVRTNTHHSHIQPSTCTPPIWGNKTY